MKVNKNLFVNNFEIKLFIYSNDLSKLKIASCTDNKCLWSAPQKACLEQYDANPLSHHKCYQIKESKKVFPEDVQKAIRELIFSKELKSTLSEHMYGHE